MNFRAPLIMSMLIVAVMLGLTAWAWQQIPVSASIAVHWGLNNKPNGFASKPFALLFAPGMALFMTVLFAFALPPLMGRQALAQNATAYEVGWIGSLSILAVCHVLIILAARGLKPDVGGGVTFGVALLMAVIGNFLGKTRPNPFVGLRTFWTLRSDYSWEKSNRALGRMFVATGLTALVMMVVVGSRLAMAVMIAGLLVSALVCAALSYVYWRNDPERTGAV